MNILIPHTWLLEHLETNATPLEIQKYLSLSGPSVERIYDIEGEEVYDIEITTNRVDSMSVRGVAREAAVILTQAGFPSKLKSTVIGQKDLGQAGTTQLPLPVIHNDPKLCKRIMCVAIADVKKTPSPEWMQKRLRLVGINSHDAIIDISNYVTHDLGHPCHTFDYDKVMATGGEIFVKEADKGKKFAIIDGSEFVTVGGEVVFENKAGEIIDLPAIKGTKNTSIGDDTKNVLFWIESLDPKKVRFASMTHAIRTVAAQLNEKNVDPNIGKDVMMSGTQLLCELAGGRVASELYDEYSGTLVTKPVYFKLSEIERYLGISIDEAKVIHILETLECIVTKDGSELKITPPTFRPDLEIGADIVEEIARIYGYHNLPSTLMTGAIPTNRPTDVDFKLEWDVKQVLSTLGAYEVYTYSMIDQAKVDQESGEHIKIANPLTDELTHLRTTLWSSHIAVLRNNPSYKKQTIFEFANVYMPVSGQSMPNEEFHLTITSTDDERKVKGMIEAVAKKYHLHPIRYVSNDLETTIVAGSDTVGKFLVLSAQHSVVDIDWKAFLKLVKKYPLYTPESKFTPITEDLTFTIPKEQAIGRVLETMEAASGSVKSVTLKDLYKRNATFSLSYEADKQLTAEDAAKIRSEIVKSVSEKHQAVLVGKIDMAVSVRASEGVEVEVKPQVKTGKVETEPIYLLDSYAKEMDAKIVAVEEDGKNKWKVYLERTVFYPMGGGQPTDQGELQGSEWKGKVNSVMYKQGEIIHFVESKTTPIVGSSVHGTIDWERRLKNMRVHSGGHIVDYAMFELGYSPKELVPTKGDHGKKPFILYTGSLFKDIKDELQGKVNEIIKKNLELRTEMTTLETLQRTAIYLQPGLPTGKPLRMLTLESVGSVADGGTQVHKTGEVRNVSIENVVVENGTTTVHYSVS